MTGMIALAIVLMILAVIGGIAGTYLSNAGQPEGFLVYACGLVAGTVGLALGITGSIRYGFTDQLILVVTLAALICAGLLVAIVRFKPWRV